MITNVYVDGFNLYYRALRGTNFKWLDLCKLAENLFPEDTIAQVCYFTAHLLSRPGEPGPPQRQLIYLRALNTLPNLTIYLGTYRPRTKTRPLLNPIAGLPEFVTIRDSEEKGADVNLAMRLLVDGFAGTYQQAVVISNDSDLAGLIMYVRDELGLRVTVVNPDYNNYTHKDLDSAATRVKRLRRNHLRFSQFPSQLSDSRGVISKPSEW